MDLCARCCEGTLVLLLVLDITELLTVIAKFKHLVKRLGNFNLLPINYCQYQYLEKGILSISIGSKTWQES